MTKKTTYFLSFDPASVFLNIFYIFLATQSGTLNAVEGKITCALGRQNATGLFKVQEVALRRLAALYTISLLFFTLYPLLLFLVLR